MLVISLLLLVLMAVGLLLLIGTVRGLFALLGRRWSDAAQLTRASLVVTLVAYPLITLALFYAQLWWGPEQAPSKAEALGRTIAATMNFGVVGLLAAPLAALAWLAAAVARWRKLPEASQPHD